MPVKVTNEAIINLLRNAGEPLTNAEIQDALGYTKDDVHEISARLGGMVKRPKRRIKVTMRGGKKAWYSELKEAKAA